MTDIAGREQQMQLARTFAVPNEYWVWPIAQMKAEGGCLANSPRYV